MPFPRRRRSIRTRLTLAAVAVTILMLVVASCALVLIERRALKIGVDEALRQTADNLAPIRPEGGAIPGAGDPEDSFTQFLDPDGNLVASTPNTARGSAISFRPGAIHGTAITEARLDHPAGLFRILVRTVDTPDGPLVLVVGKNLDDVNESVHVLVAALALVTPALALLLGGLSWWLIGRTLRPVHAIQREVRDISGNQLHRRVPVPDTDDEISDLARTMNDMLERVETASDRQQQFVDDASHELRTPLTRMIIELDVALTQAVPEPPAATLRQLHGDAIDLRRLLEDLLYLARNTRPGTVFSEVVDLDDIALDAAAKARTGSTIRIDTSGVSAAPTRGEARSLSRAVDNVVSNAVRHGRTIVAVTTATDGVRSVVIVDDDGDGIPAADRHRVFDRFTRLDVARGRDYGGAGLGLAIVQEIVIRHHGTVSISDSPRGGCRFTISLPSSGDDDRDLAVPPRDSSVRVPADPTMA